MSRRRIVLIGYGAIAGDLATRLRAAGAPGYDLGILLGADSPSRERVPPDSKLLSGIADVKAFAPNLVVEAAGHGAIRAHGPACLALGLPLLVSSIGALHDEALLAELVAAAQAGGGRILLPSGALGGLDYVRAARGAADLSLAYESRKPPAAWKAELEQLGHDPLRLEAPVTLFSGDARAAAAAYPQNLNVAAALALAGPGFAGVSVTVVCDPAASGNTHVVSAASALGTMRIEIANRPAPANPKTSWIVGASLMAAVEQYFSPIQML